MIVVLLLLFLIGGAKAVLFVGACAIGLSIVSVDPQEDVRLRS